MDKKKIARINELAKKSKMPKGLTKEEKEEQHKLRQEYLNSIRQNFKAQLDNIEFVDDRKINIKH